MITSPTQIGAQSHVSPRPPSSSLPAQRIPPALRVSPVRISRRPPGQASMHSQSQNAHPQVNAGPRLSRHAVRTLPPWISPEPISPIEERHNPLHDIHLSAFPAPYNPEPGTEPPPPPSPSLDAPLRTLTALTEKFDPRASSSSPSRPTGKALDNYRERNTPFLPALPAHTSPDVSRWRIFAESSLPPRVNPPGYPSGQKVSSEWLASHPHDLSSAFYDDPADLEKAVHSRRRRSERQRRSWQKLQIRIFKSPFVPLIFRTFVWTFSVAALILAAQILGDPLASDLGIGPATTLGVVVEAVAVLFVLYITYDEYRSKPLGLRSPIAATRLILLDLLFIIFNSALLALAFSGLGRERSACNSMDAGEEAEIQVDAGLCAKQKSLAGVLFILLLGWLATFNISILRLVSKMSRH